MSSLISSLGTMIPLDKNFVRGLLENGMITDAVPGGLILGNRHRDGGIKMLSFDGVNVYRAGEMEGGEFLINHFAFQDNLSRLKEIIAYKGNSEPEIDPKYYASYRHYTIPSGHYILIKYPFAVISRAGTRKFLDELNQINESSITPEFFPYLFKDK